ncbi:aldehyde dehydrogenase family protein [Robertmurraya sp. P23]|uniref:aldehyde dehydrogenase family protein n=1 Tax=Robertmurraya sp. P23 TaxID=3436931 RepID=UPI003D95E553
MEVKQIEDIVMQVLAGLSSQEDSLTDGENGLFSEMNEAIEAAFVAQKEFVKLSLVERGKIIESIRCEFRKHIELLSEMAVEETGMGRVTDKINKNLVAVNNTPGLEDLTTAACSGDNGLTVEELSPYGVIGSITPTTNPSETIICNTIGMLAAGNAIVFSPHPTAKRTSIKTIEIINQAISNAGGPKNLVVSTLQPSIEQANIMMNHKKVRMLVATGGPAVVKAVLSTGKKAIGAGAGNPPALVDESADIEKAAKDIIDGCSFDNNLPCVAEKEVIVVDCVADCLIANMKKNGAYQLTDPMQIQKLVDLVVSNGHANKEFVGKNADFILRQIGIEVGPEVRVVIVDVKNEGRHPLVLAELMMPLLPIVRVNNVDEGIALAVEVEHGFRHTAIMHSKNIDNLTKFAKEIQTTIFVKNGPSYAGIGVGGVGYTTFTIAGPTGEGLTSAKHFARKRRCVLVDGLSIR